MTRRAPHRTCIGCRRVAPAAALVRCGWIDPGRIVVGRTTPGRGAWLCPSMTCFDAATKRRSFDRALRRAVPPETIAALREAFEAATGNVRESRAAGSRPAALVVPGKADR